MDRIENAQMNSLGTRKLYYEDVHQTDFTAVVMECVPDKEEGYYRIVLDASAFFPEEGGQSADKGTLNGQEVLDVSIKQGILYHKTACEFPVGTRITGHVDWNRRFDFMQQHSGEHIVSGMLCAAYNCDNTGFHLGEGSVIIDYNADIPWEGVLEIERRANRYIWENHPIVIRYPEPAELAVLPYRSKKALEGPVRITEFPGADMCACCGTHLARTGEVGLIKIISFAHYKSGMRLAVACGQRAYDAVAGIWADTEAAGRLLSSPVGSLTPALERLQNGEAALKARLAALQNTLAAACAETAAPGVPAVLWVDGADGDGLRRVATAITAKTNAPCCTLGPGGQGLAYALAAAPGCDVREPCKALNAAYQGRGGGKPGFCQGSLAEGSFEQVKAFLLKSLLLREKVAEAPTEAG